MFWVMSKKMVIKYIFTHHNSRDWASTDGIESHSTESVNVGVWWRPTKYRKWNVNIGVCSNTRTGSLEKEDFSKIKARRCLLSRRAYFKGVSMVSLQSIELFWWSNTNKVNERLFLGAFSGPVEVAWFYWELKKILLVKFYDRVIGFLVCYWYLWALDFPLWKSLCFQFTKI